MSLFIQFVKENEERDKEENIEGEVDVAKQTEQVFSEGVDQIPSSIDVAEEEEQGRGEKSKLTKKKNNQASRTSSSKTSPKTTAKPTTSKLRRV